METAESLVPDVDEWTFRKKKEEKGGRLPKQTDNGVMREIESVSTIVAWAETCDQEDSRRSMIDYWALTGVLYNTLRCLFLARVDMIVELASQGMSLDS